MRFLLLALVVIAVLGTGVGLTLNAREKRVTAEDFLSAPKTYDTTGGQQMKPRW
jgi:Ti type entry exclusion protein TrbK